MLTFTLRSLVWPWPANVSLSSQCLSRCKTSRALNYTLITENTIVMYAGHYEAITSNIF